MGYYRAGFDVTGIDIKNQPHYPSFHNAEYAKHFEFYQADALTYPLEGFDAYHASPPCQRFSTITQMHGRRTVESHPDLIGEVRTLFVETCKPYVIENVPKAPLLNAVMLCGSMFGLQSGVYHLRRHGKFECSFDLCPPASCCHQGLALPVYGHAGGQSKRDGLKFPGTEAWREGMGIDWMTMPELVQAIPPAYTEYIGKWLIKVIEKPESLEA